MNTKLAEYGVHTWDATWLLHVSCDGHAYCVYRKEVVDLLREDIPRHRAIAEALNAGEDADELKAECDYRVSCGNSWGRVVTSICALMPRRVFEVIEHTDIEVLGSAPDTSAKGRLAEAAARRMMGRLRPESLFHVSAPPGASPYGKDFTPTLTASPVEVKYDGPCHRLGNLIMQTHECNPGRMH